MEFSSDCDSIRTEDFASKFCEYVRADTFKDRKFPVERDECCPTPTIREELYSSLDSFMRMRRYQDFTSHKSTNQGTKKEARLSPVKQLYNQTLDLESIASEMFDDQLQNFQDGQLVSGRSVPTESCTTSLNLGNLSSVQPMRRDIMNKFLSKFSLDEEKLSSTLKNPSQSRTAATRLLQHSDKDKVQSDKKEVNWKTESNSSLSNRQLNPRNNLANDIRQKSLQIQNEIHEERKRKSESQNSEIKATRQQTPREQLDIKVRELDQLTDRMCKARADREKISDELNCLRNNLKHKSLEVRSEKRWMGNISGSGLDNGYYQTADIHPGVQTSQNQLMQLNAQLTEKKSLLNDLECRIRQRINDIQNLESIGLSKEEIRQVIEERNELYEILRQSEENGNDRYELEKQLTMAKEELSIEYKRSREKISKLEEELDNSFKKISILSEERERMIKELQYSKETMQKQQDDISEILTEKNELKKQVDKYKEEIDAERNLSRQIVEQEKKRFECHLASAEAQTKMTVGDLKNQLSALQAENISNVEQVSICRSKISQLEGECRKLKQELDLQETEFRERSDRLIDEKNETIEKIRKEFSSRKENEVQTLKIELDSEQVRTINSLKECYKQQNSDLQARLENKAQEMQDLKAELRRIKQEVFEKESDMKSHYETEILRMREESKRNLNTSENKLALEAETLKGRYEGLIKKINQELEEERNMNSKLKVALDKANKDIAHESELAQKFKNEKSFAINKLKETAKTKLQEECTYLKEYYEKELENQLKMIEQSMQDKNSQMIAMSENIRILQKENMEIKDVFSKNLSDLCNSVQNQCSQMANEGKFVPPSFGSLRITDDVDDSEFVQVIIKNFQICCQEYSQYFHELVEKIREDKDETVKSLEEKRSREVQAITDQILKDHAEELNGMSTHHKQELMAFQRKQYEEIEALRRNVKEWKLKTADRLAQKLQKEFCKEIERKSSSADKLKSSSLSLHSFKNEASPSSMKPIGLIEDLRLNIRQLRDENLSLRKVILGQNESTQFIDQKESDYFSLNGSLNSNQSPIRRHSVDHDSGRQPRNFTDSSVPRSGSRNRNNKFQTDQ